MKRSNGTQPNKIAVVELLLDSGVRVLVKPLSPYTRHAVIHKLTEQYPDPDMKEFEEQIEGQSSPGATIPVTMPENSRHDEYKALVQDIEIVRTRHLFLFIVDECVIFPDYESRDSLIAAYKDDRERLAFYMDLPTDKWEATLYHCICASAGDINEISTVTRQEIDIMEAEPTEDEILAAWRVFRPRISRSERSRFSDYASLLQKVQKLRGEV